MEKNNYKKILSMDLSLNLAGFCVAEVENGQFKIIEVSHVDNKKGKWTTAEKLDRIASHIEYLLDKHKEIDVVVRERGFTRFAQVTQLLFRVVGVSDLTIYRKLGLSETEEIPPTTIKSIIAGYSRAEKKEVEAGIREFLPEHQKDMEFYSDDEADAVAVAITSSLKKGWLN